MKVMDDDDDDDEILALQEHFTVKRPHSESSVIQRNEYIACICLHLRVRVGTITTSYIRVKQLTKRNF